MIELVSNFENILLNNYILAPFIAFISGLIFSFSPCVISQIPLLLVYIVPGEESSKNKVKYTIFFSIGILITFISLGIIFSILGVSLHIFGNFIYLILGVILILLGLQIVNIFKIPACKVTKLKKNKKGLLGALFMGVISGFISLPCTTPILLVILSLITVKSNLVFGLLMLLCYGLGHIVIFLIAGFSISFFEKFINSKKANTTVNVLKIIFGIAIIIFGLYFVYTGL